MASCEAYSSRTCEQVTTMPRWLPIINPREAAVLSQLGWQEDRDYAVTPDLDDALLPVTIDVDAIASLPDPYPERRSLAYCWRSWPPRHTDECGCERAS